MIEATICGIEGQLNAAERQLLASAILGAPKKPKIIVEVGTWLGGGSSVHILNALEQNGQGHLWGIEADQAIFDQMIANLRKAAPAALHRFTPLFGFSQKVIPQWLAGQAAEIQIDLVFLDGGNNPREQITEFHLLEPHMPVGAILMAHDAKLRKGKWLVPYIARLDNWQSTVHDISEEGLLHARKTAPRPSAASLAAARRALLRLTLDPVEIAARLTPRRLCALLLGCLPARFARRLADGRK
jgi:predicted O-methyltransferase YrrM